MNTRAIRLLFLYYVEAPRRKAVLDFNATSGLKISAGRRSLPQSSRDVLFLTKAFAELAGVSIRTLHHYDRMGLLKPKRSNTGYRLYHSRDLERLEQISALKFLGLPLAQIGRVLDGKTVSFAEELTWHGQALAEKRRLLNLALSVIKGAEAAVQEGKPTAVLLRQIMTAMSMQNDNDWMMQYYSPRAQEKIAERAAVFTPEMQAEISEAWKQYYRDLNASNQEEDPDGRKAAELSERHRKLIAAFTGNDPEIEAGLAALYRDRRNWPDDMKARLAEYEEPDVA